MQVFVQKLDEIKSCYRTEGCIMIPIINKKISPYPYFLYQEWIEDDIKGYLIKGNQKNLPQKSSLAKSIIKDYEGIEVTLIPISERKKRLEK